MGPIISLFWSLCLMRVGPEQVPTVKPFVALVTLGFVFINLLIIALAGRGIVQAFGNLLVWFAVVVGGLYFLLSFKGLLHRFTATYTAILGQDIMITIISSPFVFLLLSGGEQSSTAGLASGALLFFYGWSLLVSGFILHRALNVGMLLGFFTAFALYLCSHFVEAMLFMPQTMTALEPPPPQ